MTIPAPDASLYTDFRGISDLKRDARAQDPQALRHAARQFESLFTRMMLKSMREASFGDPMLGSDQQNFYRDMFDDQFAIEMSKGRGLGLADMLVQQLTRAGLAPPTAAAAVDPKAAPLEPNSLLNPYASASSTTPRQTLRLVPDIDVAAQPYGAVASAVGAGGSTGALPVEMDTASTMPAFPATSGLDGTPENFVRALWPEAERAGRELGVDPKHILAQAALETGWGRSVPSDTSGRSSHNFFGIKSGSRWNGATVSVRTLEYEGGVPVTKREQFRAYASPQECFRDYVGMLRDNPRYAAALDTGDDAHAFARGLQSGGYATDPAYARKVAAIAQNLPLHAVSLKSADVRPIDARTGPL
jgi:flagellar protein FlgJ